MYTTKILTSFMPCMDAKGYRAFKNFYEAQAIFAGNIYRGIKEYLPELV